MKIQSVERKKGLTKEQFKAEHLDPLKPVILTDFIQEWPARDKWTFDYLRNTYGHLEAPIYDGAYAKPGKDYMKIHSKMKFGDYLTLIESKPSELRMFLFNIFRHAPELVNDIRKPTIMDGFIKEFPFMFFGGQGSRVKMHYDIDHSHVFLTQFQTRKKVYLFSPQQSKYLYHLPYTVMSMVDITDPDFQRFPALEHVEGYECTLEHGETLFMPSMYWHHIEYVDGGYSLSLRASDSLSKRLSGALNIARHFVVDRGMNIIMGEKWYKMKEDMALKRSLS